MSFAAFRALLDFKTPLKVALATNAVNALLDPLLMPLGETRNKHLSIDGIEFKSFFIL